MRASAGNDILRVAGPSPIRDGPAAARLGGRLWVAWFTAGGDAPPGIRVSVSDDGGASFSPPAAVSGSVVDANHPDLVATEGGRVLLTFQGRDTGRDASWGRLTPWVVDVTDPEASSAPAALPYGSGSSTYPSIAGGPAGQLFVAWTEAFDGRPRAMMARARRR